MPDSTPVNSRTTAAFDKAVAKAEQQAAGSGQTAAEKSSTVSRTELASLASKVELSSLVREIKEPVIVDLSDKNLEKFIQPELIERKSEDGDSDGPSYSEALLFTKELMKNYNTVAKSVTSMMELLRDEQSNITMLLALPKRIYGYFTYGPNADDDKPLKNAKVAISGFYTLASPSIPSIVRVECTTDDNGYFEVQMPAGYKLNAGSLDFLVTRGKVGDEISVSKVDLTTGQGNMGSHRLKKEFVQSEGILERLDDIIYHIKDVLEDLDDAEDETLGQPKVVLGEEGTEFSLTWAGSAISKYTYKLLHRLVEPELTALNTNQNNRPIAGIDPAGIGPRAAFTRLAISGPIDVESAKSQLLWDPDTVPIMSSLGMGYILSLRQEWTPTNFSLGNLLYSLALAPGEEQKLIVTERADAYTINDAETLSDQASETYQSSQADDTSAIYNSAMREQIHASSEYYGKEKGTGTGLIPSLYCSSSKTTLSGWSTSNQNYAKDFSSNFAEAFNQQIQRSAQNMRSASRTGIRMATSEESRSVTSKIIANNNHSHALTMQYWEVLRNYSINTKVDDVQLACYIPLKPVRFLPPGARQVIQSKDLAVLVTGGTTGDDKSAFYTRYDTLLRHYDSILPYIPSQHRKGLTTLKTFATHPAWKFQKNYLDTTFEVTLTVNGSFLPYDDMQAYIVLKDGRRIRGQGIMTAYNLDNPAFVPKDRDGVIQLLKTLRNNTWSGSYTATFMVPTAAREEFSHLEFGPAAAGAFASLASASQGFFSTGSSATSSASSYTFISHYMPPFLAGYEANPSSFPDLLGFAERITGLINEQYKLNTYRLNQSELSRIGPPHLAKVLVERVDSDPEILIQREGNIPPAKTTLRFGFDSVIPMMTMTQLQSIEATFQHVVENTIAYSQAVWLSLTADERAMLLELFSIGVPAAGGTDLGAQVPLMNCVTNKVEGFYGNCMIMPFDYPPELADALNTSSKDIQDALYRYHTEAFRAPQTKVSVSTNGMVGEAVLGSSNASEKIDITRFWNWQDSPIERAPDISAADISNASLLEGKTAPSELPGMANTFTLPNVAPTAMPALAEILASKDAGSGVDFTGRTELAAMLTRLNETSAASRDTVVTAGADVAKVAIQAAVGAATGTMSPEQIASTQAKADASKTLAEANVAQASADDQAAQTAYMQKTGSYPQTPKADAPKAAEPKAAEPKAEEPKADAPKAEEPKADEPKADAPKADEPKADEPKADEPKSE